MHLDNNIGIENGGQSNTMFHLMSLWVFIASIIANTIGDSGADSPGNYWTHITATTFDTQLGMLTESVVKQYLPNAHM